MSLSDTAEYWQDVKRGKSITNNHVFVHAKGLECGYKHKAETIKVSEITCRNCKRVIQEIGWSDFGLIGPDLYDRCVEFLKEKKIQLNKQDKKFLSQYRGKRTATNAFTAWWKGVEKRYLTPIPKVSNPEEIERCLIDLDIDVIQADKSTVTFWFNGEIITYFPKKQWSTGKGIQDGRGWKHLYIQLIS